MVLGKGDTGSSTSTSRSGAQTQIPDELSAKATHAYANQDFASALDYYAAAIDKLHSMYVSGEGRFRQPGPHDGEILSGVNSALGATLAMNAAANVDNTLQRTIAYLGEISRAAGSEGGRYQATMHQLERTLRLGR